MPMTSQGRQKVVWPSLLGSEKFSVSQLRADLLRLDGGTVLTDAANLTTHNPATYNPDGGYLDGTVWYDETAGTLKVRRLGAWWNIVTGSGNADTDLSTHVGSNPIAHANGSVGTAALGSGAVTPAKVGAIPHARIRISLGTANIVVSQLTPRSIPYNEKVWDNDAMWVAGATADRLTVKTAGLYFIHGAVRFLNDPGVGNVCDRWIIPWRNASTPDFTDGLAIGVQNEHHNGSDAGHAGNHLLEVSCTYRLAVNDWIRMAVRQTNGNSASTWLSPDMTGDVPSTDYTNFFEMVWLAP